MACEISRDVAANLSVALRAIGRTIACPKDGWVFRKGDTVRSIFLVVSTAKCACYALPRTTARLPCTAPAVETSSPKLRLMRRAIGANAIASR